jgi:uncharacterized membrane protein YkvA (DUF1232 family)
MPTKRKSESSPQSAGKDELNEFFLDPASKRLSTAEYVAQGVTHVSDWHVREMQKRLAVLRDRVAQINDSPRLQLRLEAFLRFMEETADSDVATAARQEVAFALAYFFHSADRIPDGTPHYGLLDDALVVEAVLERNEAALREHWRRAGRSWPEPL